MEEKNYHRRPQDDLPYEQHMKHIIKGYRYLYDKMEQLVPYTKELEEKNKNLNEKLSVANHRHDITFGKLVAARREVKRLTAHIEWLKEKSQKGG